MFLSAFSREYHGFLGWGGVGWGGELMFTCTLSSCYVNMIFSGTCTLSSCYANNCIQQGGVGWRGWGGLLTFMFTCSSCYVNKIFSCISSCYVNKIFSCTCALSSYYVNKIFSCACKRFKSLEKTGCLEQSPHFFDRWWLTMPLKVKFPELKANCAAKTS